MENFTIFHQIFFGNLSPFCDSLEHQAERLNFLKKRYPDCEKHYKVKLRKALDNYQVQHYQEFCCSDLENMIYSDRVPHQEVKELTSIIHVVSRKLGFKPENVTRSMCELGENMAYFELNTRGNYDDLLPHEAKFYYYKILLHEAVNHIRRKLPDTLFMLKSEKEIKLYVKNCQAVTSSYLKIILRDFIPQQHWHSLYEVSTKRGTIDIFKIIYHSLEDVLVYLEKSFGRYLDYDMIVPYQSRLLFTMEYSEELSTVLNRLEQSAMDKKLYEIILAPFDNLGKAQPLTFSYHDLQYHKEYLTTFYRVIIDGKTLDKKAIVFLLWEINFNSLKFFNYLTHQIKLELREKEPIEEKLERLFYYLKLSNQIMVTSNIGYNRHLPPLKDQMCTWLQEEISFLENKPKNKTIRLQEGQQNEKIPIRMSVPQLSLIARAFFETGLVGGTRKDLLRFFSDHFRTDQQENISLDSLTGKYYKIETSTKRTVGRMMKKMLAHIENAGKLI